MNAIPQIEPITTMARDHTALISKLDNGPVILAHRSKPAAVLVSINEWNQIADELARLRRAFLAEQRSKEMDENPALEIPFTREELTKRGIING
ncbi:MAG: hypothetical protein AAF639_28820 [Chloroflexota bacterium]